MLSELPVSTGPWSIIIRMIEPDHPRGEFCRQHFGIDDTKYSGAWEIVGVFRDFKMNDPRSAVRPVASFEGEAVIEGVY